MKALGDIFAYVFVGGILIMTVRWMLPMFITSTSGSDNLMTYFYPILILICIVILCMLAFKKRKQGV